MISLPATITAALAKVTVVMLIAEYQGLHSALVLFDHAGLLPLFTKCSCLTYLFLLTSCLLLAP